MGDFAGGHQKDAEVEGVMAKRRAKRPTALWVLASAYASRVRRTAEKVREGKVALEDVERDIREDVDARVRTGTRGRGRA